MGSTEKGTNTRLRHDNGLDVTFGSELAFNFLLDFYLSTSRILSSVREKHFMGPPIFVEWKHYLLVGNDLSEYI